MVRHAGLSRFAAASLLAGYAWLALAGAIAMLDERSWAGHGCDAYVHAVLLVTGAVRRERRRSATT